jgi:DNA-binding NarL/FixJ family response regulator
MRVVIAEDELAFRTGMLELLSAAGVEVIQAVGTARELLAYLGSGDRPDVVILDIRMETDDAGLKAAEVIGRDYPEIGILVLTNNDGDAYVQKFFAAGSARRGYLLKEQFNDVADVRFALDRIHRGHSHADPAVMDRLLHPKPTLQMLLSPRELDVLELVAAGRSNASIQRQLKISLAAVDNAIQSIYAKLDIPRGADETPRVHAALRWWFGTEKPSRA